MATHDLEVLLLNIHRIIDFQDKIAAKTGDNFNVFKILGMEALEVRTHSSFLRELLDPKGSHGMGSVFLELFLSHVSDKNAPSTGFDSSSATVTAERPIGPINKERTRGGRIDLFLEDKHGRRIFIENKIYAEDQENQLLRYHAYDHQAILVYLTLKGTKPSPESTGGEDFPVKLVSYDGEIIQWLESCKKESVSRPIIRETLTQYIDLIRYLTNRTTGDSMNEEIEKLLREKPEYIAAVQAVGKVSEEIKQKANADFLESLKKAFADNDRFPLSGGMVVKVVATEDRPDGVYIGYKLFSDQEDISGSTLAEHYCEDALKAIKSNFHKSGNWLGWYNPKEFAGKPRFSDLDLKKIFELRFNSDAMGSLIGAIVAEEKEIREKFVTWQAADFSHS